MICSENCSVLSFSNDPVFNKRWQLSIHKHTNVDWQSWKDISSGYVPRDSLFQCSNHCFVIGLPDIESNLANQSFHCRFFLVHTTGTTSPLLDRTDGLPILGIAQDVHALKTSWGYRVGYPAWLTRMASRTPPQRNWSTIIFGSKLLGTNSSLGWDNGCSVERWYQYGNGVGQVGLRSPRPSRSSDGMYFCVCVEERWLTAKSSVRFSFIQKREGMNEGQDHTSASITHLNLCQQIKLRSLQQISTTRG